MKKFVFSGFLILSVLLTTACKMKNETKNYHLKSTAKIIVTSEAGDKLAVKENVPFKEGQPSGHVVQINPEILKQKIDGIGSSFTEASAFVLAHLDEAQRHEVMRTIFSEDGANFSMARTHIGACDFSVEGKYSYDDEKGDVALKSFSIQPDLEGFDSQKYPGIKDPNYDLLPMIKEALQIKSEQKDQTLNIVSSAWTAPWWMKDIEDWYIPGSPENNWQGTGGSLKKEYYPLYAEYLIKYLKAYQEQGVDIWGITPVNEPHGNNGSWESMHFTPQSQNEFIKKFLGPELHQNGFADLKLLIYDQNRDGVEEWTNLIFADPETAPFVYGVAVHWYSSTFKVYEDVFDRIHQKFPDFAIIHTEGCIDDLGKDAPNGVSDPGKYKETNWFNNDAFWWNQNASDWAYSVTWQGINADDHPAYTPVHRYARDIIVGIDHWLQGWIDWNVVLDRNGGPNHVGNFCGAPIMIDTQTQEVYYTPIYYILAQFSKTIRPGDQAIKTDLHTQDLDADALHACATINAQNLVSVQLLNTTKSPITYQLQIGRQFAEIEIPANAVQTVQVQL